MLRGRYIVFTLLILLYLKTYKSLPPWVHRVDSCPDPNEIRQWIKASIRLNCYHNLTSNNPNEQANVYHCLPTTFVNETVEFCSRNVPVAPGNCPVYNYKFVPNIQATYFNCSSFTSGCPAHMFFSKNVFKYQECLRINKRAKCYEASKNCSLTTRPDNFTDKIPQEQTSTSATTDDNLDSDEVKKMLEKEYINERIKIIAVDVTLTVFFMTVGWYLFRKRKLHVYIYKKCLRIAAPTNNVSEEELETLNSKMPAELDHIEERRSLLKNMYIGATIWRYNELLEKLKKNMTSTVFNRIKHRLKAFNTSYDLSIFDVH